MYTSKKDVTKQVAMTLLKPAINLLNMIEANKLTLLEMYEMKEEQADEIINIALDIIRQASEAEKKARKMCEEHGKDSDEFVKALDDDLKSKGFDTEKEYAEYEQAASEFDKYMN